MPKNDDKESLLDNPPPEEDNPASPEFQAMGRKHSIIAEEKMDWKFDCGTKRAKFLSHEKAKFEKNKSHPRKYNKKTGNEDQMYSLRVAFGWHTPHLAENMELFAYLLYFGAVGFTLLAAVFGIKGQGLAAVVCCVCGALCMGGGSVWAGLLYITDIGKNVRSMLGLKEKESQEKKNPLYKYGLGMVLYFKMLKFYVPLFALLTFLSVPALTFFTEGSVLDKASLGGATIAAVSMLGSMGGVTTTCITPNASAMRSVTLDCGEVNSPIMSNVQAYYGHPHGACGCPAERRPNSKTGKCDGGNTGLELANEPIEDQPCCGVGYPPVYAHIPRDDPQVPPSPALPLLPL